MSSTTNRCSRLLAALAALALASGCQVALSTLSKRAEWGTESSPPSEPSETLTPVAESDPAPQPEPPPETNRTVLPEPAPEPEPEPESKPERTEPRNPAPERAARRTTSTKPAQPAQPAQPTFVSLSVGERAPAGAIASCKAPGRGEMCNGVCTDVQVNNDHCGMCGNDCNPGSHCDFSTCRNAEGKPE